MFIHYFSLNLNIVLILVFFILFLSLRGKYFFLSRLNCLAYFGDILQISGSGIDIYVSSKKFSFLSVLSNLLRLYKCLCAFKSSDVKAGRLIDCNGALFIVIILYYLYYLYLLLQIGISHYIGVAPYPISNNTSGVCRYIV